MRALLTGPAILIGLAVASPALAQLVPIEPEVVVCPAPPGSAETPDFEAPGCETVTGRIDPQGRMIWVKARLPAPDALFDLDVPLGVFVLAKASSETFLNGELIGRNGAPGASRAEETPGLMDAVAFAPRALLRADGNELVLRMSSHHGVLRLVQPVHFIGLGRYAPPQSASLHGRWPALVTFGALLAGACYFAAAAARGEGGRRAPLLLALMSLLAAGQLLAETARALVAYPYPLHDVRLIVIWLCAAGFGLALAAHIIWTFAEARRVVFLLAVAGAMLAASLVTPGFDQKTVLAVLVPALACAGATAIWTARRKPRAGAHLAALLALSTVILSAPYLFLDVLFYYAVAAFLLFLFVQQAFALGDERRLRRAESTRAARLELVLEQARAAERPASLKIVSAGRIELAPVDEIISCKGAGDYVEIRLLDGREMLHNATLNELEESLPPTFLRVHRSHIVNTAHVRTLKREASGVGALVLSDGSEAPVSRRVMPKVRVALD